MADVLVKHINYNDLLKQPDTIIDGIKRAGFLDEIKKKEFIALKVHCGEKGNISYTHPDAIAPLVRLCRKKGARPFLFETNTLYRGQRLNAIDHINLAFSHGFGKLSLPLIIGDGIKGNDVLETTINKKHFTTCHLAAALKDIDVMFVCSHFTGHMLAGFGAAIKNIGMGCAARRGKMDQHCEVSPVIHKDRCIACGECARSCPVDAIDSNDNVYTIISEKCIGCAQCVSVCPQAAVKIQWSESYGLLGEKMVEYAYAVTRHVKCLYITFALFITKECDCMNKEDAGVVDDIGVLFSSDPVSIDKAVIDLLNRREDKDIIRSLYPQIPYEQHLRYAQDLGLGSLDYRIVEI